MLIKLHSQATTTPKVRAAIQASDEPAWVLAERHGTTEQTVWKWRKRETVEDRSHTPHRLQTTLTRAQESVAVALRKTLLVSLEDLLAPRPPRADPHEAVALIRLRRDAAPNGCLFLFPGDVPRRPVVDLKRLWERMRVQADILDVCIHDLRHTFASLLVSGRASMEMIRRLLGHTQIGTTQRYAHLIDSPLPAGVKAVG